MPHNQASIEININKERNIMDVLRITSRKTGEVFDFEQKGTYLYCNGYQICHGGNHLGETMFCGKGDIETAEKMCRSWYRQMMRKQS